MTQENKDILLKMLKQHKELGISEQIDYDKFYLYSIITHSTAIEGSTVTEVEAQLLFDEGITSSKRTMVEQMMNLDLKVAYEYGMQWIRKHDPITIEWLVALASKVMARTGSEYHSPGGDFDASKGELRKLNVTAGIGGKSYMSYLKVPMKLQAFCEELNRRRSEIDPSDIAAVYELSFWAHFELVTIHPWADGNGRTCRLLMNLLQMEYGVLPTKVLKEDKAEYIQALIDTREEEDMEIFMNCMSRLHCQHLRNDIDQYLKSVDSEMDSTTQKNEITTQKAQGTTQKTLNTTQKKILNYLKEHPHATRKDMAAVIGDITEDGIKFNIGKLQQYGLLKREGGRKSGTWVVIDNDVFS
ncbi:MAG: Fic family protein [Prevotella sp.]|nr:Fic family protein [Prevotellaceae bacterium]MDY5342593.1 Fic family protein [Prevotella sp.]